MPMIDISAPAGVAAGLGAGRLWIVGTLVYQLVVVVRAEIARLRSSGERRLRSEPFEPLGGETFRMEAIWRSARDSRKGRRLG